MAAVEPKRSAEPPASRLPVVSARLTWQGPESGARPPPGRVRVELLTDPWSVWCWGFEPVRRALQLRYPSIEFRHLLGGMFPTMPNPAEVGFDVERFFAVVQRTTGMPVTADGIRRDPAKSTYPACVAVHAVRLAEPTLEAAYLRALREAVYLDQLNISRPDVEERVAASVGVPRQAFREALKSGRAEESFQAQIEVLHKQDLHAYPTYLVSTHDRVLRVEGFQSLPAILGIAESVSGRAHPPSMDPTMDSIIPPVERVATREVAEALGVSLERAFEDLQEAAAKGKLTRERVSGGDVWSRAEKGAARRTETVRPEPRIRPAP